MSHTLIVTTQETEFEGELIAFFNGTDGVYSTFLNQEELCQGISVEVEAETGKALFVRLPRPTSNGNWCVWVPNDFVEETRFCVTSS